MQCPVELCLIFCMDSFLKESKLEGGRFNLILEREEVYWKKTK